MTELADPHGAVLADYVLDERAIPKTGRELIVDLLAARPGVAPGPVAAAALAAWPGRLAATEQEPLAAALRAGGATVHRHVHRLALDLRGALPTAPTPPGATLGPLPAAPPAPGAVADPPPGGVVLPDGLGAVSAAAYPPGHVDHHGSDAAALQAELAWLATRAHAASRLATDADGAPLGLVLVDERTPGGGWVYECFRDPDPRWAGLGAALLAAAAQAAAGAGLTELGLVVTEGNAARRVYERLGLTHRASAWTLRLPGEQRPLEAIQ